MSILRRVAFQFWLARARLTRRFGSVLLAGLGIAAGAATLASVLGAGTVSQDESLARAVARLPAEQRVVRAAWFGSLPIDALDPTVRHALAPLGLGPPIRAVVYRQTTVDGKQFNLAAADRLGSWVRVSSGRLPRECTPERCEVIQVGGSGPIPDAPGLHLARVGTGSLVSSVPFLQTLAYGISADNAYAFNAPSRLPPFLLAGSVQRVGRVPLLRSIHRSFGWIYSLRPRGVHPWSIDRLSARIEQARSALDVHSVYFDLSDPLSQFGPTVSANRVTARRLLLVGGQAVALLLAFVVLVAAGNRREAEATRARLAYFGARRWQAASLSALEAGGVAIVATLAGWAIGVGITAAIADAASSPGGAVLAHSALSAGGIGIALGLAAAAASVLLLALHVPGLRLSRFSLSALDVAALGALAAIALAFARGSANAETLLREQGTGVLLFLLPALIAFVAAVAGVRLLVPAVRLLERGARRLAPPARLAALSLARNPGYAGAAAAFLLASVGLAAFSVEYRSTLARGESDQARYAVPTDVVVEQPANGRTVLPPLGRYAERAVPVLRLDAQVGSGAASRAVALLGLPAQEVRGLPFWRGDFASSSRRELGDAVDPGGPVSLRGARLPGDARELRLPARDRGEPIRVQASVENRNGSFLSFSLGTTVPGLSVLHAPIPAAGRGGRLVGLAFAQTETEEHGETPASGTLVLGPFSARTRVGSRALPVDFGAWIGTGGIRAGRAGDTATLSYFVSTAADSWFRPRQRTDGRHVPVIATPGIAAEAGPGGLLPVHVGDLTVVTHVVRTATRFPTLYGDFVVADRDELATALNAIGPGAAIPNQAWLEGVSASDRRVLGAALRRPPLVGFRATFQRRVEASLRGDPLARAVLRTLAAVAIVGFALALAGIALALTADLRDERGELFDLEAQGAGPRALRRHLRLRSGGVLAFGVLAGAVLGVVLSVLVVDAVLVTANGRLPEPPLLLSVDWPVLLVGLAVYLACAAGLVSFLTWNAFRERAA